MKIVYNFDCDQRIMQQAAPGAIACQRILQNVDARGVAALKIISALKPDGLEQGISLLKLP